MKKEHISEELLAALHDLYARECVKNTARFTADLCCEVIEGHAGWQLDLRQLRETYDLPE